MFGGKNYQREIYKWQSQGRGDDSVSEWCVCLSEMGIFQAGWSVIVKT